MTRDCLPRTNTITTDADLFIEPLFTANKDPANLSRSRPCPQLPPPPHRLVSPLCSLQPAEIPSKLASIARRKLNLMSRRPTKPSNKVVASKSSPLETGGQSIVKSTKTLSSLKSISSAYRMKILPIKALQDNYMYLLIDEPTRLAAAVDPVNASAVASAVHDYGVELKAILTTHHHYDHAHGNADLLSMFPDIVVYGGDQRVQALQKCVTNGEVIRLGTLNIECLSTPCHTKSHICYYVTCHMDMGAPTSTPASPPTPVPDSAGVEPLVNERAVFTGDTLFIAGCGRFFEGTAEQMDTNLNTILASLPNDTKVYCGHEYTVANLKFALHVEPHNLDIKTKLNWAMQRAAKKEPTIPSSIGEEKKINPFMRVRRSSVKKFTGESDPIEVMTILRTKKNDFQP